MPLRRTIRNFSIIAHIDHGKSTLADRILELTGALSPRERGEQVLDTMDLERERGITIKAHAVRLAYPARDGQTYILNLIDTPGHVDFTYEVSRSLAACEGALLLIDATQGVEAQTIANAYLAIENDLEIIPVINKIDLPAADVAECRRQVQDILGLDPQEALLTSAKEGWGVPEVMEAIVQRIPPPKGDPEAPLQALLFDSWYNPYQGVVIMVRVFAGRLVPGQEILLMSSGRTYTVQSLGVFTPRPREVDALEAGEVGYVVAGIKEASHTRIGDTVTDARCPASKPLPGYREVKPMVFSGLYPVESDRFEDLREALDRLHLNDASFTYEPETSLALGFGFRCGFLGLLHMEIIRERLEREFGLNLISTAPTVVYKARLTTGEEVEIDNPTRMPPPQKIETLMEPFIRATLLTPGEYVGGLIQLCQDRRGIQQEFRYVGSDRVMLVYELPLNEVVLDFYDRLKSVSRGYASLDYEFIGYRESDLVRLDILLNGERVDALSSIVHQEKAYPRGRQLVERMRELIPRQLFEVVIQAAIGSRVIARESIKPLRKNVTAKCYGGDVTRKRKLLEKQKEGKKRLKQVGRVEVPPEAFLAVLRVE